jgi:hypothetical protein
VKRLKLKLGVAGGVKNAADQSLCGALGAGRFRPYRSRDSAHVDAIADPELRTLVMEIARDLHRCADIGDDNVRVGHILDRVRAAAQGCERTSSVARVEFGSIMSEMMEAFLLVNDTLPVYDRTSLTECNRATEKRWLAAAILSRSRSLWFPDNFSLGRAAVGA